MLKRSLPMLLMIGIAPPVAGIDPGGFSRESIRTPVIVRPQRDMDSRGPLPVLRSGKWGYINVKGMVVIAPQFDEAGFFYEGRAAVRVGMWWGYVDSSGKMVIPARFGSAARFSDGLAHVRMREASTAGAKSVYIDAAGQVVISCDAQNADVGLTPARCGRPFFEGLVAEAVEVFRCVDEAGNPIAKDYPCRAVLIDRWGYYDRSGRLALPGPYHSGVSRFSEGLAAARRYGEAGVGFIDASSTFVLAPQYDQAMPFSEGLAAVRSGTLWGFINHQGTPVIAPQFQSVSAGFSDGYAAVRVDGLFGYIDRTGRVLIRPRFQDAGPFSEGLAAVCCENGRTRYIDTTGRWAFGAVFTRGISGAGPFIEGVALVEIAGRQSAYVDRRGSVIAPVGDSN